MTLDVQGILCSLLEVKLEEVTRFVTSEQTLNQDRGAVALKASFEAIDVNFEIKLVLLCAGFVTVVGNVPLHVLVQTSKSVTKWGVFNSLLVCDHIVVESFETGNRVDDKVTVARNSADWICKKSQVHNCREWDEWLQVLPLADVIVVKVKELEASHASKHTGCRHHF